MVAPIVKKVFLLFPLPYHFLSLPTIPSLRALKDKQVAVAIEQWHELDDTLGYRKPAHSLAEIVQLCYSVYVAYRYRPSWRTSIVGSRLPVIG